MTNPTLRIFLAAAFTLALAPVAFAQAPLPDSYWRVQDTKTNTGTYFYYLVAPGAPTMRVQVLGAFRTPGLYEIGEETDLGQLIALAGGPSVLPQTKGTRLDISLRVFRPTPGGQQVIFEDDFDRFVASPNAYPKLMDGDVLIMDMKQSQRLSWRDISGIVSTIGILALAYERVSR